MKVLKGIVFIDPQIKSAHSGFRVEALWIMSIQHKSYQLIINKSYQLIINKSYQLLLGSTVFVLKYFFVNLNVSFIMLRFINVLMLYHLYVKYPKIQKIKGNTSCFKHFIFDY